MINRILKEYGVVTCTGDIWVGTGSNSKCSDHDNEPSDYIKQGEFLHHLNDY
jgi:hypothetical protein